MFKFLDRIVFQSVPLCRRPRKIPGRAPLTSVAFQQHSSDENSSPDHDAPPITKRSRPAQSNEAIRAKRSELFAKEKTRQLEAVRRVEKIEVRHKGVPEACTLMMNKNLSTPHDCTMHIAQMLTRRTALALVNGKPWDMHRPLESECDLQFLHFMEENPSEANLAFWRTGSLLLSYVADRAFRDDIFVEVHSWPYQNIQSGSFICDVDLKLDDWQPKEDELRVMSLIMSRLVQRKLPIERLEVSADFAMTMFQDNRFKRDQIPRIAEKSPTKDRTILYKVDDHVEISSGPMVANTGLVGRHQIATVHPIDCHGIGRLFRFQGIALPAQQPLNYFAWNTLVSRARNFNDAPVPSVENSS